MNPDVEQIAMLLVAAVVGATIQSTLAFGQSLVLGPALLLVVVPSVGVGTAVLLALTVNVLTLAGEGRRPTPQVEAVRRFLPAALPGLLVGGLLLDHAPRDVLRILTGIGVVVAAGLRARSVDRPARTSGLLTGGFFSGLFGSSTSLSGPPLVIALHGLRLSPAIARDTLAATLLAMNVLTVGTLVAFSDLHEESFALFVVLLPAIVVGHRLGSRLVRRMSTRAFERAALLLVATAGLTSLSAGALGMAL